MVEIDVQLSRDGMPVVVHDDDLRRCSDVAVRFPGRSTYSVSEFSLHEIQTLDAGSWFVTDLEKPAAARQLFLAALNDAERHAFISDHDLTMYGSGLIKHPTLTECLARARDLSMLVNVEIKNLPRRHPGIVEVVVTDIERAGLEREVLVSSFDHQAIATLRRLNNAIATAVLTSDVLYQPEAYLTALDADAYHPEHLPDPVTMEAVLRSGRGVNVWTENDCGQMQILIDAGVSGIVTDYPNRLRDLMRSLRS